jgi:hypothetical protein
MLTEKPILWAAILVVVLGAGGGYYYYYRTHANATPPPPAEQVHLPPPAATEPGIQHPVPSASATGENAAPLPALNDSDQSFHDSLVMVPGAAPIEKILVPQSLIRHIVATIDNMPRKKVALELRPIKSTSGQMVTAGDAEKVTLSPQNEARYAPFVELVKSTDTKQLVALYFHFYPLFQQAYEDLGYPSQYFNDRLIEVIDNLLATPDVKGPVELTQPNVLFLYADPKLEALSAGQKTLLRMGPDNERIIKDKLRQLREAIATKKK